MSNNRGSPKILIFSPFHEFRRYSKSLVGIEWNAKTATTTRRGHVILIYRSFKEGHPWPHGPIGCPFPFNTIPEDMKSFLRDKTCRRMVLEGYGKAVLEFDTADEVLFAFRDAIAGHQNLWNSNILHRDVSINNILIGLPGADEGWRGVLIDLDMATWLDRTTSLAEPDFRTGSTRAFQSVSVLTSVAPKAARSCSDYLDDLESFFYVLVWICFGYSGPRKLVEPFPRELRSWEWKRPLDASRYKMTMYLLPLKATAGEVTPFFGDIFQELLENLCSFFKPVVVRKVSLPVEEIPPSLTQLVPAARDDYATILGFVDDAIKKRSALQSSAVADEPPAVAPTTPVRKQSIISIPRTPLNTHLTNVPGFGCHILRKRTSDLVDLEDESPSKPKKQKKQAYIPSVCSSLSMEQDLN